MRSSNNCHDWATGNGSTTRGSGVSTGLQQNTDGFMELPGAGAVLCSAQACVVTFQCQLDASKLSCELIVAILHDAGDHQFVLCLAAV